MLLVRKKGCWKTAQKSYFSGPFWLLPEVRKKRSVIKLFIIYVTYKRGHGVLPTWYSHESCSCYQTSGNINKTRQR